MAKDKDKKKIVLPKAETIKSAQPLVEAIKQRKERLAKLSAAATKDGKLNKYEPKYREALKALKRAQRALKKELLRVVPRRAKPAEAPAAPAASGAPAEGEKK